MTLPYLTSELTGTGGMLRTQDDDFAVDEELPYAPSGAGDHVFVRIEKRGLTTIEAARRIARALGVRERDIGIAGMKDRRAVTRQWLSLPPPVSPEQVLALLGDGDPGRGAGGDANAGEHADGDAADDAASSTGADGGEDRGANEGADANGSTDTSGAPALRVLEARRHPHKLRTGHVRANRFVLRIRGVDAGAAERARAILAALSRPPGAPNWYGEQRFGKDGDNAARGKALVTGARPPGGDRRPDRRPDRRSDRRIDRLMVSALQSQLFNDWLAARLGDGLYRTVLAGDVLHKRGGGMFVCEDPATDQARLDAGELVVTGPMFGVAMRAPAEGSAAFAREAEILAAAGLERGAFAAVRAIAEGTRRDAAIEVAGATVAAVDASTLEIGFALPGGAYATAVMREVMKTDQRVDAGPQAA